MKIQDLCHSYGERSALDRISLDVKKGEIFGVLGPNGSGKTTLFHILSTLICPKAGDVELLDLNVVNDSAQVRKKIGVIFQSPSVDPKLTVFENLRHQGHLYGLFGLALTERIEEVLLQIHLKERQNDLVETLSGGLARRVEIAKGLLHKPQMLLLDEPSSGLDPGARRDLWKVFWELKSRHVTILLTTHLMEEADACDRVMILDQGRIVAMGTPKALKNQVHGKIVSLHVKDPKRLAEQLTEKFKIQPLILNGSLQLEDSEGAKWVPKLMESFPDEIESVTVRTPTLEDVFMHHTGHKFKNVQPLS